MKKIFFALAILIIFLSCHKKTEDSKFETKDLELKSLSLSKTEGVADNIIATDTTATINTQVLQGTPGQNPDWDKKLLELQY